MPPRGAVSSVGRTVGGQPIGRWFESSTAHQNQKRLRLVAANPFFPEQLKALPYARGKRGVLNNPVTAFQTL